MSGIADGAAGGSTIRLKGGGEVRLAGIAPAATARESAALATLVDGQPLDLFPLGEADRYGRIVAQATAGPEKRWVQAMLVHDGLARAMPEAGDDECSTRLLALEDEARTARRGFWSGGPFSVAEPGFIPRAAISEGAFAVVETTVRRIGESGGRIYLDSSEQYWKDFSIVIPREAHAAFAAAGVDLRGLLGKRVRARGMLFSWYGPAMELRVPAALEVIGTDEG